MARPEPRRVDRRNLWPWRCWMTIGIGAICTIRNPHDCLILASDKLGSFGDTNSTKGHAKMFVQGERDCVFAVCAGSVENASELVGNIVLEWRNQASAFSSDRITGTVLHGGVKETR